MGAGFAVELSDLRGYAALVESAGADTTGLADYARSHVTDGDFGRILELITAEYEALIPAFHAVLDADGEGLRAMAGGLDAVRADYVTTDASVAQTFGQGARITDDGSPGAFGNIASLAAPAAPSGGGDLPEVSFGFLMDKVCDLIVWVGGPDPREYVTKWIVGDIAKASMQASAWEIVADCVKQVERKLASGASTIATTWTGRAATSASAHADRWVAALADQASGMDSMAGHLRDMIQQAMDMAQVVVDIIKTVVSMVSACLSSAYIPGVGAVEGDQDRQGGDHAGQQRPQGDHDVLERPDDDQGRHHHGRPRVHDRGPPAGSGPARVSAGPHDPDDRVALAWAELRRSMAAARVALDRARATPVHTPEERAQLQRDALSGGLGREMQELAEHVAAGRTSWGEVFEGTSPYSSLLDGHLTRMSVESAEAIRIAIVEDEDYDPLAPDPEV